MILLLAIAVVLPTVCLLWFMTQAVKNERLAVRQRLVDAYQDQLASAAKKADEMCLQRLRAIDERIAGTAAYEFFNSLVGEDGYNGLLTYGESGERIYPLLSADINNVVESAEEFSDAWRPEFEQQNFAEAVKVYEQKADSSNPVSRFQALIGKSRCLAKLDRWDEAVEACKQVAFSPLEERADARTLVLIGNARLLLAKFLKRDVKYASLFEETFQKLFSLIYTANEAGAALPADNNLFLAHKILKILRENPFLQDRAGSIEADIRKLMAVEECSIRVAKYFPAATAFDDWPTGRFRRLQAGEEVVYGLHHKAGNRSSLLLLSRANIASALSDYESTFKNSDVAYSILDNSGRLVTGLEQPEGKPFVAAFVGEHFPGWKAELYFQQGDVFEKAASRQVAMYTWAGVLVTVLILSAGGFAGQVVGRQIKLNRLKNDFIATVSHELRTPLASMRVLVDTLLEGRYKGSQQATEYLHLVSKENERLTRLIDNFLTFSRMERNKQAFEMVKVSPAAIAHRAAEAVKTKFEQARCKFDVSIDENLPDVLADQDAMVTAIVNLLDNAYKYSYDDKQIQLRVFTEDGSVCFRVSDNGIGLSRRAAKRIFKRFYQVDRSLSRHTEGCGLGLSIVKFIVDAHKGQIEVESKPGKGSEFCVKIPLVN